jgi:hypothetical protein
VGSSGRGGDLGRDTHAAATLRQSADGDPDGYLWDESRSDNDGRLPHEVSNLPVTRFAAGIKADALWRAALEGSVLDEKEAGYSLSEFQRHDTTTGALVWSTNVSRTVAVFDRCARAPEQLPHGYSYQRTDSKQNTTYMPADWF